MTNFEHLRNKTRNFDGMLETLADIDGTWSRDCVLEGLAGAEIECPSDCTCRTCLETWLSSEYTEKKVTKR